MAVSGGLSFVALTAISYHTCGLTSPGAACCWGDNRSGQFGDGSTTSSAVPVAVSGGLSFSALVTGGAHTCGLIGGGAAYCWGDNSAGELGTGSTTGSTTPVAVSGGLGFGALVTGSDAHTCGLIGGGAAYCWGDNSAGQLGTGSTAFISTTPAAVAGGLAFNALAAGGGSVECGVTNTGAAYCWGENLAGQLGDGSTTNSLIPVAVSGGLSFSALTAGVTNSSVIGHTCGLTTAGAAYCWGDNDWGQLGDGSTTGSAVPVAVSGGLSFISLVAGSFHTCGVSSAGAAYCWGDNSSGQLGRGTFDYSTVPVAVATF